MNAPSSFIQANYPSEKANLLEPIAGPTAETVNAQAAQRPVSGKFDYALRGGYGNTAMGVMRDIEKKKVMKSLQNKYENLVAKGERGADDVIESAVQNYGEGVREYVPPKEYFYDPATGQFLAHKYFESAYVGVQKYKEAKARLDAEEAEKERGRKLVEAAQTHAKTLGDEAAKTGSKIYQEDYVGSALQQPYAQEKGAYEAINQFKDAYQSRKDDELLLLRKEANRARERALLSAGSKANADLVDKRLKQLDDMADQLGDDVTRLTTLAGGYNDDIQRAEKDIEEATKKITDPRDGLDYKLSQPYYNEEKKAAFKKERDRLAAEIEKKRGKVGSLMSEQQGIRDRIKEINEGQLADVKNAYREYISSNGSTGTVTRTIKDVTPEPIAPPAPGAATPPAAPAPRPATPPAAPIQTPPPAGGMRTPAPAGAKRISSQAEFDALTSGTYFIGPDGKTRRKP